MDLLETSRGVLTGMLSGICLGSVSSTMLLPRFP